MQFVQLSGAQLVLVRTLQEHLVKTEKKNE